MPEQAPDMILEVYLQEFDKLKSEQTQRIGFRDNMIYVTLVAIGGVASFAIGNESYIHALLILPWVSFIMGWMYLDNDAKISALGAYFRDTLAANIRTQVNLPPADKTVMGWEYVNQDDPGRIGRKYFQFAVNQVTFCISGLIALGAYYTQNRHPSLLITGLMVLECALMIALALQFCIHSDLPLIARIMPGRRAGRRR